ncbi:MAG: hypothetical protein KGN77_16875 [Xanthomonadaceae bacterium]|nr:hypothetical protein [Xanthomonadaceae bacterium]MDE1963109.1 hypothetical protein [Xanthomonadaceae bacterium]
MGISPWVRRHPSTGVPAEAPVGSPAAVEAPAARCIVVLPAQLPPRTLDLLGRAFHAAGAGIARAGRILVADGKPQSPVPHAPAYLIFGQAQAHALGRELPAPVMDRAHIALVESPETIITGAEGKRRLWAALRQLRRALAAERGD